MHQYKTVTYVNFDILYFLWNNTNTEKNWAVFFVKQQVISSIQIGWSTEKMCPIADILCSYPALEFS